MYLNDIAAILLSVWQNPASIQKNLHSRDSAGAFDIKLHGCISDIKV